MIKHKPLVQLPGISGGELPVKISGINVSGLGISWLQTIVAGNEVQFVPVLKDKDAVHCEVTLQQPTKDVSYHYHARGAFIANVLSVLE